MNSFSKRKGFHVLLSLVMVGSLFGTQTPTQKVSVAGNVPGNLSFVDNNGTNVISWDGVANSQGYNVYRSTSRYGQYTKINSSRVYTTSYTDNTATDYYYKVTSYVNSQESGLSDPISEDIEMFGNNVYVFDPNDSASQVQSVTTGIWSKQETNQFGTQRYAFLFKPGNYSNQINFKVGYYTQVAGLGKSPTDTTLQSLNCDARWLGGDSNHNATCNFWRSAENLTVNSNMMWAVSQAVSLRRMKVNGNLYLHDNGGWASGGFLADSYITGSTESGSQQQWLSRNCNWNYWTGQNWNMVFVGIADGKAPSGTWPNTKYTTVNEAPTVQEKPFLTYDKNSGYSVFVPERRTNAKGTSWQNGVSGTSVGIDKFYVAKPEKDNADTINAALKNGKNLILTPGIYYIDKAIEVTNPDTIVLGLGLASLMPTNGNSCMNIADVDGVKVAGVLFDAGTKNSTTLLKVGEEKNDISHASNPIVLSDVYFRVGGFLNASTNADSCVTINSNDVIGDNFWVWRADHGSGVSWYTNKTKNGIIVNGDDVTMYALMVEHFHEYQTVWNGDGGRTYFYQSELPYDVPNQNSWKSHNNTVNGYASYKVGDNVKSHEAWGLGIYAYHRDATVDLNSAMEVPDVSGVKVNNICTVMLTGNPGISHVVNYSGGAVTYAGQRQILTSYGSGSAVPTITLNNEEGKLHLATITNGATIKYTLDGSTPSRNNGKVYTGEVALDKGNVTVKAMAYKDGLSDSSVVTKTLSVGQAAENIALGKPVYVSSTINDASKTEYTKEKIVDGDTSSNNSRWESEWADPQWATIDLQDVYDISKVKVFWEVASAKDYKIQVSQDNVNWKDVYTVTDGALGATLNAILGNNTIGRYVRIYGTSRTTEYGYSIYEVEVYGTKTEPGTTVPGNIPVDSFKDKTDAIVIYQTDDGTKYAGQLLNGSYLEYRINVPQAGNYKFSVDLAGINDGRQLTVTADGVALATINPTVSGGWTTFDNYKTDITFATAGIKTLRLTSNGSLNIANINITKQEVETTKPVETTKTPEVTTVPEVTTKEVEVTTTPEMTTKEIEATTAPEMTTKAPEITTKNQETTTKKIETTTKAPETTVKSDVPIWNKNSIYVGGNRVLHNGVIYEAKWWTTGEEPGTTGQWGVWKTIGNAQAETTTKVPETTKTPETTKAPETTKTPETTKAVEIPAKIAVDSYSAKTDAIVIYSTDDGTKYAGQLLNGSYLEYNISVKTPGKYTFKVDLAGINEGRQLTVIADGTTLATINPTVSGGWTTFDSYNATIEFKTAGTKKLRLTTNGSLNIANIEVKEYVKQTAVTDVKDTKYRCIGYIPNWSTGCYKTLDYNALTHLNIAFCNPDSNGNISAGMSDSTLKAIIDKAHQNGVKVLASMGGAGYSGNYPNLTSNANRGWFNNNIINYLKKYGFDGVDLDVEGEVANSFWGTYEAWVRELREKCNQEGLLLTTAVGQWYADNISNQTFTYFDFVTIMEYDCNVSNYQGRINYFLNTKKVKRSKLVLGVPFYGYRNGTYTAYKDILASDPNAWASDNSNGATYDGVATMGKKAKMSKNYGGTMIWELSQDAQGEHSLLKAIKEALIEGETIEEPDEVISLNADQYSGKSSEVTLMTSDEGTSYAGNFVNGSYIEYTVNVKSAGTYKFSMDLAGIYEGITFTISTNGQTLGTISTVPTGGWTTFEKYSTSVKFDSAGTKTIRISTTGAMNIANIKLTK